ncbi:cation-translocating P-type ATPase [Mycoplasma miroungirhinis]|uniref:Cation-translocating P-type ATPase n=1 Tax=Mycoplasma miroungirhinis TaxID=754516 RepID=A0A6M4JII3_9MOLU|nr:cation-translocating P-type ATPase [Mycoplasma miroungirhinis]QJR44291.1 cation-translocating P-type ATPase [Mycoplasma miroungirhinis]
MKNIQDLNTNPKLGLNDSQINDNQIKYGKNILEEKKKRSIFLFFLEQFKDLMVILLLIATIISFGLAIYQGINQQWNWNSELTISFIEPCIILIVVVANAIIGTIQEIKSQKAVDALKNMSPMISKVIRNGKLQNIKSKDIVVGDILFIESGDVVGADGILLESHNLYCIESSLTGESVPSEKNANAVTDLTLPIADQKFKVFSSTSVSNGTGLVLITEVGKNTEIGKISKLLNEQKTNLTPLQLKINKLGKIFGYSGIILFILSLIAQIIFQLTDTGNLKSTSFWSVSLVNSISLAVAAIPEGLVAFTTIILSLSVKQMANENAIVKNLMAVETLGSTAVICSDKTGTLTQNKMTVVDAWKNNTYLQNNNEFYDLFKLFSLCTEANIFKKENKIEEVGDPTEIALLHAYEKYTQLSVVDLKQNTTRLKNFPFDSERKLMSVIYKLNDKNILITKGAPESIFNLLEHKQNITEYQNIVDQWAKQGFRVLALATKKLQQNIDISNTNEIEIENNLQFEGLIAMIDPPRETSKESIDFCKKAGMKPIMITGDNLVTASAIAKELGILNEGDLAITSKELDQLSDEELEQNIQKYAVYARVAPKDKIRIVKAWQKLDQVVAMTGDGVNDAPALKAADIGCAMGITGTEVSKQASDLILVDDNFSTVVKAVSNGRKIYERIRNVIQNLLVTSVAEIILVVFGLLIFRSVFSQEIKNILNQNEHFQFFILSATQLLWINLFTHGFPAIALGIQNSKETYMNIRPHSKFESIFARRMGWDTLWQGIFIGILSLIGYYLAAIYALHTDTIKNDDFVKVASTVAFLIIGIGATFNSLNLMTKRSIFISNPLYYWKIYLSIIFSIVCLLLVVFIKPFAQVFNIFVDFSSYSTLILYSFGLVAIIIPVYTIYKLIINFIEKRYLKSDKITNFEIIKKPSKKFIKGQ